MAELAVVQSADCLSDEAPASDYWTLEEGYFAGCWIAHIADVNLDDLVRSGRQGAIIRVRSKDALKYVPPSLDDYERIAGLVSDAA